jgi:hypothetical protein
MRGTNAAEEESAPIMATLRERYTKILARELAEPGDPKAVHLRGNGGDKTDVELLIAWAQVGSLFHHGGKIWANG